MSNTLYKGTLTGIICLLTALTATAEQASTKSEPTEVLVTGQQNASKWFRAESQHFIVYSDTSHEDVTQLLSNLERLDFLLRTYMKVDNKNSSEQKLTLYYQEHLSSLKEIDKDQPEYAIGLYNSCTSGVQGFGTHLRRINDLTNEQLGKHPLNEGLSYIFEAYTRHFLYRYTDIRNPTSFIDGFAQYFASTRFSETQMVIGKAPTSVANYLNFLKNGHRYSLDYTDILEQNDSKGHNYAGTAGVRLEFEAKSWILTHYMLSSNENLTQLRQYLTLTNRDIPATQAFEQAFGYKPSQIGHMLWKYQLKTAKAVQFEYSSLPTADISFSSLPLSATNLILADAALKSCPTRKVGESILQKTRNEAKKFPASDFAQLTLSRAQIDWGNAQDAIPYLTTTTEKSNAKADAFYLLGLAQQRLAEQSDGPVQQTYFESAQRNLWRGLSLDIKSPEIAHAFFKTGMKTEEKPSDKVLGAAILAWKNAHEVNAFGRSAALVYAYLGNLPEAQNVLALMTHNIRDPKMAAWAKIWQDRFKAGVSAPEILAEMRLESPAIQFKEWTMANEEVMQDVQLNAGMESAQSMIDQQQQQNMDSPGPGRIESNNL